MTVGRARVGAVAKLTLKSVKHDGSQYTLRFPEKGGKSREIPVRHDLERAILAYIDAAGIADGPLSLRRRQNRESHGQPDDRDRYLPYA